MNDGQNCLPYLQQRGRPFCCAVVSKTNWEKRLPALGEQKTYTPGNFHLLRRCFLVPVSWFPQICVPCTDCEEHPCKNGFGGDHESSRSLVIKRRYLEHIRAKWLCEHYLRYSIHYIPEDMQLPDAFDFAYGNILSINKDSQKHYIVNVKTRNSLKREF